MATSSRDKPSILGNLPGWGEAILTFVILYVAVAVVFTTVTLEGLGIGGLVTGVVAFALGRFVGEESRVAVLGGAGFAVVAAIVAAVLS